MIDFRVTEPLNFRNLKIEYVKYILNLCSGDKTKAAKMIGMSYRTLINLRLFDQVERSIVCEVCGVKKKTKNLRKYCSRKCYKKIDNARRVMARARSRSK